LYSTASSGRPSAVVRSRKGMYGSRPAPTPCRKMMGCRWSLDARCLQELMWS
jgi:hypothetical protein